MLNKKLDWHFFLTIVAFDWRLKISINFLDRYFRWHLLVWFFATELFRGLLIVDNCQECLRLDPPENACTKNDNVIYLKNIFLFQPEFLMDSKNNLVAHDSLFYVLWGEGSSVALLNLFLGVAQQAHHKELDGAGDQNRYRSRYFPDFFIRLMQNINFYPDVFE